MPDLPVTPIRTKVGGVGTGERIDSLEDQIHKLTAIVLELTKKSANDFADHAKMIAELRDAKKV